MPLGLWTSPWRTRCTVVEDMAPSVSHAPCWDETGDYGDSKCSVTAVSASPSAANCCGVRASTSTRRTAATCPGAAATRVSKPWLVMWQFTPRPSPSHARRSTRPRSSMRRTVCVRRERECTSPSASWDIRRVWFSDSESRTSTSYSLSDIPASASSCAERAAVTIAEPVRNARQCTCCSGLSQRTSVLACVVLMVKTYQFHRCGRPGLRASLQCSTNINYKIVDESTTGAAMSTTTTPTALATGTWTIDPSHSEAAFTVRHAGIAKVRGTVAIADGAVVVAEDGTASVTATLDPTTVNTGDAGRDGHLKTADFFEVETHPTWTFTSAAVPVGATEAEVPGELTI